MHRAARRLLASPTDAAGEWEGRAGDPRPRGGCWSATPPCTATRERAREAPARKRGEDRRPGGGRVIRSEPDDVPAARMKVEDARGIAGEGSGADLVEVIPRPPLRRVLRVFR